MNPSLLVASAFAFGVGAAHSYLGERLILIPLHNQESEVPRIRGSGRATKRILRFAWHLTTVAWWGFAAMFAALAFREPGQFEGVFRVASAGTFGVSALITAVSSRGRHLAWPVFGAIALLAWFGMA